MKTTPSLQRFIERLAAQHGLSSFAPRQEQRIRFELEGETPLLLILNAPYVTLSQLEEEDGEMPGGQEVMLYAGDGEWAPVYASRLPGLDRTYAKPDWEQGGLRLLPGQQEAQVEEALRCGEWARNLEERGWLERSRRSR